MVYIAFLRAINVGGKNSIKMSDLRTMFVNLGFEQVQTYIQSGNVLFVSTEEESILQKRIETAITETFDLNISVVLRTLTELETIITNCPFSEKQIKINEALSNSEVLYVYLFLHAPSQVHIERLEAYDKGEDKYRLKGKDLYLLFQKSISTSSLVKGFQKIDIPFTSRNWKTLTELIQLGRAY